MWLVIELLTMVDVHSKEQRSRNMAKVRSKDTGIELAIRKGLYARGYRYRKCQTQMAGKPDIVLTKYKTVIFVNGCFWHYHDCSLFKMPASRSDWWRDKLSGNKERDRKNVTLLQGEGWRIIVVWECAIRSSRKKVDELLVEAVLDKIEECLSCDDSIVTIEQGFQEL